MTKTAALLEPEPEPELELRAGRDKAARSRRMGFDKQVSLEGG